MVTQLCLTIDSGHHPLLLDLIRSLGMLQRTVSNCICFAIAVILRMRQVINVFVYFENFKLYIFIRKIDS